MQSAPTDLKSERCLLKSFNRLLNPWAWQERLTIHGRWYSNSCKAFRLYLSVSATTPTQRSGVAPHMEKIASDRISSTSFAESSPVFTWTTLWKREFPFGKLSVMLMSVSPMLLLLLLLVLFFFFHPSEATWKNMASRSLASDSAFTSSNLASNLAPTRNRLLTGGKPSWLRNALNLGCSTQDTDTVPHDSYSHSARRWRAASVCALLGPPLCCPYDDDDDPPSLVPGLLSFFTLSSSIAKAPKSCLPPDSNKGIAGPTLAASSALGPRWAGAATASPPMETDGGWGGTDDGADGEGALRFLGVVVVVVEGDAVAVGGSNSFGPTSWDDTTGGFGACTTPWKFGHVPRFRCSEAVREGFDAENIALQSEHRSFTALGTPVSGCCTKNGSRCAQYHAPLPLIALFRTATSAS